MRIGMMTYGDDGKRQMSGKRVNIKRSSPPCNCNMAFPFIFDRTRRATPTLDFVKDRAINWWIPCVSMTDHSEHPTDVVPEDTGRRRSALAANRLGMSRQEFGRRVNEKIESVKKPKSTDVSPPEQIYLDNP